MKWLVRASLIGAAWSITVIVLSLVFGTALPISPLAMAVTAAPVVVILIGALARTNHDSAYYKLHSFSPAAKRLLLLYVALVVLGAAAFIGFGSGGAPDGPFQLREHSHVWTVSEAEYLDVEAAQVRVAAGWVLLAYTMAGAIALVRMHYRPVVIRH